METAKNPQSDKQSGMLEELEGLKQHVCAIPETVIATMDELCRREGISMLLSLEIVAGILFHRYSGQDHICMERKGREIQPSSITMDLSCEPSFSVLAHRLASFLLVSAEAAHGDNHAVSMVFTEDVMRHLSDMMKVGDQGSRRHNSQNVVFTFAASNGRHHLCIDYDAKWCEQTIAQLARHYMNLLEEVAANPDMNIDSLRMLGKEELNQIIVEWNNTYVGYEERCAHELFEEQASRKPNAPALIYNREEMTYGELNSRANQLGHYLVKKGVGPEVLVGICLERSPDAALAILGIMKAGGGYVALNPRFPVTRLNEMVVQSGIKLLISHSIFRDRVPAKDLEIIEIDRGRAEIESEPQTDILSGVKANNLAYVTFTSGSSGRQKGVMGIHRSITNGLKNAYFDARCPNEVCCWNSTLSFGPSIATLLLPLCSGLPIVVIPEGNERDPDKLARAIAAYLITSMVMVPSLLRQFLSLGPGIISQISSIRSLGVSGSTITLDLVESFAESMPNARMVLSYSFSEIGCCASTAIAPSKAKSNRVSMGRAYANTHIYILDHAMNPVPVGVTGELYVAASHLARGYLGQPELTAEHFLTNPFELRSKERMFRTGDLGRYRPDGEIELIGRVDNQVKIRGFRVELSEVEAAIKTHPVVKDVAVKAYEMNGEQRLAAYLVMVSGTTLTATDLRRHVENLLPSYMVPFAFVFVEQIPLSENGKPNINALAPPDSGRPQISTKYEAPHNSVEAAVAEIWAEILGFTQIGINDDYLDLGGDSLGAARIASRIRDKYGVEIPLPSFFEWLTVGDLADEISRGASCRLDGVVQMKDDERHW